jgi:hypothetical protein
MRGAGEDVVHGRRERAEELSERAVVLEVEAAVQPVVSGDGALHPETCPRELDRAR